MSYPDYQLINPTDHPLHLITDPDLETFLALSVHLTGYSKEDLYRTGMLEEHFTTLMKEQDHENVRAFLLRARDILKIKSVNQQIVQIKQEFIAPPPGVTSPTFDQLSYQGLAPRITLLWYSGAWTTMNDLATKSQWDRTAIPSARAYKEGLIWRTAATHPAGAKQPGFGSWESRPDLRVF